MADPIVLNEHKVYALSVLKQFGGDGRASHRDSIVLSGAQLIALLQNAYEAGFWRHAEWVDEES